MEKKYKYGLTQTILALLFAPFLFWVIIPYLFGAVKANNLMDVLYFGVFFLTTLAYTSAVVYLTIWGKAMLTNESIFIGSSGYTIDWKDIKHIGRSVVNRSNDEYIEIYVRDPKKYIDMIRNPLIRFFKWKTRNLANSPFYINLSNIRGDNEEIFRTVLRFYQNNRGF
jgi:hypothetical protein